MSLSKVAIIRCENYDGELVYHAIRQGVDLLGGLEKFVRPGERIVLKPNVLAGDPPETATATHPAVLAATIRLLREGGAGVSFGDSPGMENYIHALKFSGLYAAGVQAGAEMGDFGSGYPMNVPGGKLVTSIPVAEAIHAADGIINLPKMKTHQLTRITGAVKNMFGAIPGKRKALYHVQFQDVTQFSELLAELMLALRPRLHILDGVLAMEGNGPRSGDPRWMKVLVLSADPIALDATFCRLIDLDPSFVPTNLAGYRRGVGVYQESEIEYVGEPLAGLRQTDFKVVRKPVYKNASYAFYNSLKNLTLPRPVIDPHACKNCGLCVQACPVPDKALRFEGSGRKQPPVYNYNQCIRCYCCHEMCPSRAIRKQTPLLGRVLHLG